MTLPTAPPAPPSPGPTTVPVPRPDSSQGAPRLRAKARTSLLAHGQPMVWLTGGSLAICLVMIIGLLVLVFCQGLSTFWPVPLVEVRLVDGKTLLGEVVRDETYRPAPEVFLELPADKRPAAEALVTRQGGVSRRRLLRTGNFELTQTHHHWVSDFQVAVETEPEWALVFERATNDGRFYGFPKAFEFDGKVTATEPAEVWARYNEHHKDVRHRAERIHRIEKNEVGEVNREENEARLTVRRAELNGGRGLDAARAQLEAASAVSQQEHARLDAALAALHKENGRYRLVLTTAGGQEQTLKVADVVRAYPANQLSAWQKWGIYLARWWEFLSDEPRNINSEGGVFPAIWGTAAMTLLMSVGVVPFGVLAALYLREYARAGFLVSLVRIAINNLAGVPSIVFGVFGLGFFCYLLGVHIDQLFFSAKLPSPTFGTGGILWASLTLALLTLPVVIVATEEALAAVPGSMREGSYACGASKWQTIRRIVLPRAMPGILTGTILAMARGAGEVAPLMLVGAVKLAPALPVDGVFPFVHLNRSFMHLGFHIYDVGFQSQDSESAKPMVFTTTLLLIVLIAILNLTAMWLRARLRKRYVGGQF
jgi:phosphate transport system permease protein